MRAGRQSCRSGWLRVSLCGEERASALIRHRGAATVELARRTRRSCCRWVSPYLTRRLILPLAQIHDLPQQAIFRPRQVTHFDHHLRSHPMHSRKHERRSKSAVPRGQLQRGASCLSRAVAASATASPARSPTSQCLLDPRRSACRPTCNSTVSDFLGEAGA
jgi:hypothetical protein